AARNTCDEDPHEWRPRNPPGPLVHGPSGLEVDGLSTPSPGTSHEVKEGTNVFHNGRRQQIHQEQGWSEEEDQGNNSDGEQAVDVQELTDTSGNTGNGRCGKADPQDRDKARQNRIGDPRYTRHNSDALTDL